MTLEAPIVESVVGGLAPNNNKAHGVGYFVNAFVKQLLVNIVAQIQKNVAHPIPPALIPPAPIPLDVVEARIGSRCRIIAPDGA
eukprot:3924507-Pleurochrysis_carterae.AAC.1